MNVVLTSVLGGIVGALNFHRTREYFKNEKRYRLIEKQFELTDDLFIQWDLWMDFSDYIDGMVEKIEDEELRLEFKEGLLERYEFMNLALRETKPKQ